VIIAVSLIVGFFGGKLTTQTCPVVENTFSAKELELFSQLSNIREQIQDGRDKENGLQEILATSDDDGEKLRAQTELDQISMDMHNLLRSDASIATGLVGAKKEETERKRRDLLLKDAMERVGINTLFGAVGMVIVFGAHATLVGLAQQKQYLNVEDHTDQMDITGWILAPVQGTQERAGWWLKAFKDPLETLLPFIVDSLVTSLTSPYKLASLGLRLRTLFCIMMKLPLFGPWVVDTCAGGGFDCNHWLWGCSGPMGDPAKLFAYGAGTALMCCNYIVRSLSLELVNLQFCVEGVEVFVYHAFDFAFSISFAVMLDLIVDLLEKGVREAAKLVRGTAN